MAQIWAGTRARSGHSPATTANGRSWPRVPDQISAMVLKKVPPNRSGVDAFAGPTAIR